MALIITDWVTFRFPPQGKYPEFIENILRLGRTDEVLTAEAQLHYEQFKAICDQPVAVLGGKDLVDNLLVRAADIKTSAEEFISRGFLNSNSMAAVDNLITSLTTNRLV